MMGASCIHDESRDNTAMSIQNLKGHMPSNLFQMASVLRSYLSIALIVAALLNLETVWQTVANYSFGESLSYINPLQIFGGLAFGQVVGVLFLSGRSRAELLSWSIASICLSWIGIIYIPQLSFVWLAVPFVGLGTVLVELFSQESLKRLVIASGIVGIVYFGIFTLVSGLYAEQLICFSLLLLCAAVGLEGAWRQFTVQSIMIAGFFALWLFGVLAIPSSIERRLAVFADAELRAAPEINLLFRTDFLYLPSLQKFVIVMNGQRYMSIPQLSVIEGKRTNPSRYPYASYDIPYQFSRDVSNVLVIGSAEGQNVLSALAYGAQRVVAVDINPAVFSFLKERFPEVLGGVYRDPLVHTVRMEGRAFLERTDERFDLITLQGVQTGTSVQVSSTPLLESFLSTQEALTVMWHRLSDRGGIFFDEYADNSTNTKGMVRNIAVVARDTLPIVDPARQIFYYTYLQDAANPHSASTGVQRPRAGLIIWKTPVEGDIAALQGEMQERFGITLEAIETSAVPIPTTDNRPFFIQSLGSAKWILSVIGVYAMLLALSLVLLKKIALRDRTVSSTIASGLFALGAAYILIVMSFWGPLTLIIGEPFVVGPLVYFNLYFFGLIGGIAALQVRRFIPNACFGIGLAGVVLAWFLIVFLRASELELSSAILHYAVAIAAVGFTALSFELPYIVALKSAEGTERGILYSYENLGTLFGACVSLSVQPILGFEGSFIAGVAMFACAAVLFHWGRRSFAA